MIFRRFGLSIGRVHKSCQADLSAVPRWYPYIAPRGRRCAVSARQAGRSEQDGGGVSETEPSPIGVGSAAKEDEPMNMRRIDTPENIVGATVWYKAGLYRVERVEQQASGWMAIIVRPGDFGAADAKAWFVAANQLQLEG